MRAAIGEPHGQADHLRRPVRRQPRTSITDRAAGWPSSTSTRDRLIYVPNRWATHHHYGYDAANNQTTVTRSWATTTTTYGALGSRRSRPLSHVVASYQYGANGNHLLDCAANSHVTQYAPPMNSIG
ncbi:MAG: hypothetical protein M9927_07795 [Anaerolineae bacterium]|nr:hypothetical protein [Anaerolineae bacterium]